MRKYDRDNWRLGGIYYAFKLMDQFMKKKNNRKDLNIPTTQAINGRGWRMWKLDTDKIGVDVLNSPITSKAYISKRQIIANMRLSKYAQRQKLKLSFCYSLKAS